MRSIILSFSLIAHTMLVSGQDLEQYERKYFVSGNDSMPYRILLPRDYDAGRKYPLVLFLHGSGERGSNNSSQLVHGGRLFLGEEARTRFPAIVVFPQCPQNSYWSNMQVVRDSSGLGRRIFPYEQPPTKAMVLLMGLTDELLSTYRIQKSRVYVGGLSMGGMGTFELVWRRPRLFAAAFPICGGGHPGMARAMRKVEWWIFHGAKDDVVLPAYSEVMVAALKGVKAKVRFTLFPGANHNSWDPAFAEPDLLPWLFSVRR